MSTLEKRIKENFEKEGFSFDDLTIYEKFLFNSCISMIERIKDLTDQVKKLKEAQLEKSKN